MMTRLCALLFLVAVVSTASAIDRTAESVSYTHVNDALNGTGSWAGQGQLNHGDTLRVPSGSAIWASQLVVTKNIKLIGNTVITFGPKINGKAAVTYTLNPTANQTIIRRAGGAAPLSALSFTTTDNSDKPLIQGFTWDGNDNLDEQNDNAIVGVTGNSKQFRITNCFFKYLQDRTINFNWLGAVKEMRGVMDHCVHVQSAGTEKLGFRQESYQPDAVPGSYVRGDGSFHEGPFFGDVTKAMYVEDCIFISEIPGTGGEIGERHGGLDMEHGARRVIRHSYFAGVPIAAHGTETGGYRGARMQENYSNIIDYRSVGNAINGVQVRAGTFLFWNNDVWVNNGYAGWISIAYRQTDNFTNRYKGAYGTNNMDANATVSSTDSNFVYIEAEAPKNYWPGWAGTVSGVGTTSATLSIAAPTAPAGPDGWKHFLMRNTALNKFMQINTISGTTVTFYAAQGDTGLTVFPAGSSIQVHHLADASLDVATRGMGDRMNSSLDPVTNITHPGQWAHQRLEPQYGWMNTKSTVGSLQAPDPADYATPGGPDTDSMVAADDTPTLAYNRDVFNQKGGIQTSKTSPFNVTTGGTGYGTIANRPDTFSYTGKAQPQEDPSMPDIDVYPGPAYWATDEQKLYVATANNTWTLYYEPAVYPHPLVEAPSGKIISLSGSGLQFGNIIVGDPPPTANVTVSNLGTEILTVSSVTGYTAQFTGPPDSFAVGPGATFNVPVTFTPSAATHYTTTLTFNSDATGGTNTIGATGDGVLGEEEDAERPFNVFRVIKKILSKWIP